MADYVIDRDGLVVPEPEKEIEQRNDDSTVGIGNLKESALRLNPVGYVASWAALGVLGMPTAMEIDRWKEKKLREKAVANALNEKTCNELAPVYSNEFSYDRKLKVCSDGAQSLASSLLQAAVSQGLVAESFSGLLRCNIDISKLAHSKDGFLRGFTMSEGRIAEQAKFTEVSSICTPMLVFQVASFVTGQYYQHIITTQLNSISKRVDQILDLMEEGDKAKITNAFSELSVLSMANRPSMEDSIALRELNRIAGELRDKYKAITLNCSLEEVSRSWIRDKNEAEDWVKALENSHFLKYMELAFDAEYLFYSTSVMLIKWELAKDEPDYGKVEGWSKRIDNNFMASYEPKYHEVKTIVCENLRLLASSAISGADDVRAMYSDVKSRFISYEQSVVPVLSELSPTYFIQYRDGQPLLCE